jgi:hypothetical protein
MYLKCTQVVFDELTILVREPGCSRFVRTFEAVAMNERSRGEDLLRIGPLI